jgi:hypothetical protein
VLQQWNEPCCLRVVQDDDVVVSQSLRKARRVDAEHRFVVVARLRIERAAVTRRSVQVIVNSFGDGEEFGVALDHYPTRVDSRAARVREQRLQHLCDAAAGGGGVDVPDGATGKGWGCASERVTSARGLLRRKQRNQPLRREAADVYVDRLGEVADDHPGAR